MHGSFSGRSGETSAPGTAGGTIGPSQSGVVGLRSVFHAEGSPLDAADGFNASGFLSARPDVIAPPPAPPPPGGPQIGMHVMHAMTPALSTVLRKLNARIERANHDLWTDRLSPPVGGSEATFNWENPSIPSGYTYLLQLMAHDLVASVASVAPLPEARPVLENRRRRALMLETIYGNGPDGEASAYEFSGSHRDSKGVVPRTHLRLGPSRRPENATTSDCPFRDIGRAVATLATDGGRDLAFTKEWLTEALICDQRNDSHAIISQLTVLFHLLHNIIMARLEARPHQPAASQAETAHRRFLAARLAATSVYRNIIEKDLLSLILHPQVHARYAAADSSLLDPHNGVTREFAHGAFRFGHAMVRDEYRTNSDQPVPTTRGLMQSSGRSPGSLPVSDRWLIDWSRFFATGTVEPNFSRRIGPDYGVAMRDQSLLSDRNPSDRVSLPGRDLMTASFAGLWSVPKLYARFRQELAGDEIAALLPPYEQWEGLLATWIGKPDATGLTEAMRLAEAAAVAADPPLPFFVQFEAAHVVDNGVAKLGGGGRHLGPFGSIIVAETVYGALRHFPLGIEGAGAQLKQRLAAGCDKLLGDPGALDMVPEIDSMPGLLAFMASEGAFAVASS